MPSSISSSEAGKKPLSPLGGARVWVLALLATVLLLGAMEAGFRGRGHQPGITDDMRLWAFERQRVAADQTRPLVLVGASRLQLSFDLGEFRRAYRGRGVYQLAIDGLHPLAVLQDLADDESFSGSVIVAARAETFLPGAWDEQAAYVEYYHRIWSLDKKANLLMGIAAQERLVIRNANLSLRRLAEYWMAVRRLPPPNYIATSRDRERRADYAGPLGEAARLARLRKIRSAAAAPVPVPADWLAVARGVLPMVRAIEARGGRVVFLRFPTAGEHWLIDERRFPRRDYWNRLATGTGKGSGEEPGLTMVHFADHPRLGSFPLPDLSHVDMRDKAAFTAALLDVLEAQGFFDPR